MGREGCSRATRSPGTGPAVRAGNVHGRPREALEMATTETKKTPRIRRTAEEARRVILDAAQKRLTDGGPEAIRLQDVARDFNVVLERLTDHFASGAD